MSKRLVRSQFEAGEIVELTHTYNGYGQFYQFEIQSPFKSKDGNRYMIPVVDFLAPVKKDKKKKLLKVPTDFIRKIKKGKKNHLKKAKSGNKT